MSDGLLDDVEKSIDDFSVDREDEINNEVKQGKGQKDKWEWYYRARQIELERSREERRLRPITPRQVRVPNRVEHITCHCDTHIILTLDMTTEAFDFIESKQSQFYCPKCSRLWKTVGLVVEIKVIM